MRSRHSDLVGSAVERELRLAHWPRSAAELATLGVTPARLRRRSWRRTSRGYYAPVTETAPSTAQRILDRAPLVPSGGAFSSWAAAYVLGVDMLDGLDSETLRPEPICFSLGSDAGRASTTQIRYVRDRLPVDHRQVSHGLPVTTPFRTAFDGLAGLPTSSRPWSSSTRSPTPSSSTSPRSPTGAPSKENGPVRCNSEKR